MPSRPAANAPDAPDPGDASRPPPSADEGAPRERLFHDQTRLRHLVDRLPGAVYRCTYDAEWRSLYMGAGFEDICGIAPEALDPSGRSFRDVIVPEDLPRIQEAVRQAVDQRSYYRVDYRIQTDEGRVRWIEDNGRPWFEDGAVQWLDGILLDVTQRKEAERSLQRLNESLEEIVVQRTQEVRALAAGLAMTEQHERSQIAQRLHDELQQFLYGVQVKTNMFIRNLRTRTDVDLTDAAVDPSEIEHMLQQAIDTTRGLTVDLAPPVLDQDGLLEALQWLRSHMHATSGLTVTLHGTLSDIHIPHAIQMVLFQAVRALLINVTEHARVDRAWVQLRQVDDAIIIRVVDEGVGFDVDALDVSHTGSGIRTSAERLRFLGGTLSVSSTPGDGTTCLIHLPEEAVHNAPTMPTATSITR